MSKGENIMNEDKILNQLEKIGSFKNTTVGFNKDKNIYDCVC